MLAQVGFGVLAVGANFPLLTARVLHRGLDQLRGDAASADRRRHTGVGNDHQIAVLAVIQHGLFAVDGRRELVRGRVVRDSWRPGVQRLSRLC